MRKTKACNVFGNNKSMTHRNNEASNVRTTDMTVKATSSM